MYRTGDLGWRATDEVDFLGRADAAGVAAEEVPHRAGRGRGGARPPPGVERRRWRRPEGRPRGGKTPRGYVVAPADWRPTIRSTRPTVRLTLPACRAARPRGRGARRPCPRNPPVARSARRGPAPEPPSRPRPKSRLWTEAVRRASPPCRRRPGPALGRRRGRLRLGRRQHHGHPARSVAAARTSSSRPGRCSPRGPWRRWRRSLAVADGDVVLDATDRWSTWPTTSVISGRGRRRGSWTSSAGPAACTSSLSWRRRRRRLHGGPRGRPRRRPRRGRRRCSSGTRTCGPGNRPGHGRATCCCGGAVARGRPPCPARGRA